MKISWPTCIRHHNLFLIEFGFITSPSIIIMKHIFLFIIKMLEKQKVDIHTNAHMDGQCSTVEVTSPLITHMMLLDTYIHLYSSLHNTRVSMAGGFRRVCCTPPHTRMRYESSIMLLSYRIRACVHD